MFITDFIDDALYSNIQKYVSAFVWNSRWLLTLQPSLLHYLRFLSFKENIELHSDAKQGLALNRSTAVLHCDAQDLTLLTSSVELFVSE